MIFLAQYVAKELKIMSKSNKKQKPNPSKFFNASVSENDPNAAYKDLSSDLNKKKAKWSGFDDEHGVENTRRHSKL